jgi:hypothetical protein
MPARYAGEEKGVRGALEGEGERERERGRSGRRGGRVREGKE